MQQPVGAQPENSCCSVQGSDSSAESAVAGILGARGQPSFQWHARPRQLKVSRQPLECPRCPRAHGGNRDQQPGCRPHRRHEIDVLHFSAELDTHCASFTLRPPLTPYTAPSRGILYPSCHHLHRADCPCLRKEPPLLPLLQHPVAECTLPPW